MEDNPIIRYFEQRKMDVDEGGQREINHLKTPTFLISSISSNYQFLTILSARSTSAPCSIKIRDISGWSQAKCKEVCPNYLKNHQLN